LLCAFGRNHAFRGWIFQGAVDEQPAGGCLVENIDGVECGMRKLSLSGLAGHKQSYSGLDERVFEDFVDGWSFGGLDLKHLSHQFAHLARVVLGDRVVFPL